MKRTHTDENEHNTQTLPFTVKHIFICPRGTSKGTFSDPSNNLE